MQETSVVRNWKLLIWYLSYLDKLKVIDKILILWAFGRGMIDDWLMVGALCLSHKQTKWSWWGCHGGDNNDDCNDGNCDDNYDHDEDVMLMMMIMP